MIWPRAILNPIEQHELHHLYNPGFSPNGKWIVSTGACRHGFSHAILAIEAHGDKIINLKIPVAARA